MFPTRALASQRELGQTAKRLGLADDLPGLGLALGLDLA